MTYDDKSTLMYLLKTHFTAAFHENVEIHCNCSST